MTVSITNASDLNQKDILKQSFREYIDGNTLRWLMGTTSDAVIQLKQDESKGRGDTIYFNLVDAFDPTKAKRGDEQLEGNEVDLKFHTDSVTIDYVRYAAKVEQKELVNARTPVEVVGLLKPQLLDAKAQTMRDDIIDSAAITATPNRTRVLFGSDESGNYNATLATALANVDATNDKMSLAMAKTAKRKALNIAAYSGDVTSRRVRPMRIVQEGQPNIQDKFVMLLDPISADHLQADTEFKDLRDDMRKNDISAPFFDGSRYLGEADGIMFYMVPDLTRIASADGGASSTRVAHNLLLGAQAFAVGIGLAGKFSGKEMDYGLHMGISHTAIYGTKMLKFDGIENGVVHVFATGEL